MTDAEASLLGTEFSSRFRVTGVRTSRSFASSDGEPEGKRPHNAPSTPMSSVSIRSSSSFTLPTPASRNSSLDAAVGRLKIEDSGSSGISDSVPSVVGPSGSSEDYSRGTTSGTQDSFRESSASSMMSITEGRVLAYAGTNMVMSIQAGEVQDVESNMGMYLSRVVIPELSKAVDQDDVDMAGEDDPLTSESGAKSNRRLASGTRRASRRHRRDESPNDSETSQDNRRAPSSSRDDMLTQSSASGFRTRGTSGSSRTTSSRRSRTSSSGSGAAQVAMNGLHQIKDGLARMRMEQDRRLATLEERQESFLVRQHQAQLDARLVGDRQLQSAIHGVEALAGRLADMESRRQRAETTPSVMAEQVKVEDQPPASLDTERTQVRVTKDGSRRPRVKSVSQAEYEQRWQQRMAEVEEERARWTAEATRAMGAQQEALAAERASLQQLKNTEEHRRSQEASETQRLQQQFQDLRATVAALFHPDATTDSKSNAIGNPDSATQKSSVTSAIKGDARDCPVYIPVKNHRSRSIPTSSHTARSEG
ncbi:hypothetical protein PHMEG_00034314 [Phytophthora megakarya]|uniref:Uncharacterized protein n=1 Tax=Phytophthora megakarya TaxID=4795 RepID=A0A225URP6_9STRA|nr:hypothetical protein PHMEG_00034314 [Phytophthora megakarya]